jgi:hypothetical protein
LITELLAWKSHLWVSTSENIATKCAFAHYFVSLALTLGKSMSHKKDKDDLPDFKDQCHSRSIIAVQDPSSPATRRIVASSPREPASNTKGTNCNNPLRSVVWPENDEETPPAVEAMIAEAIPFTDSQLRSEEPVRQTPTPLDTTVVRRQQEEAIARAIRRYAVYLLLLIVVVTAAVVGGVCGAGKCSSSSDSNTGTTPTAAPVSPNATAVPTPEPNTTADRAAAIASYINSITLTNKAIAYPPTDGMGSVNAEELALQWLIALDPLSLNASSDQFQLLRRYVLVTLWFQTTNHGDWYKKAGWLTTENECNWVGITCVEKDAGVIGEVQSVVDRIELPSNNMRGSIPADLGLLWNLTLIDFSWNSLSGSLPQSVGNFIFVKNFVTRGNALTGTLPKSIGLLQNLKVFDLSSNFLSGSLPESIGQWSDLERSSTTHLMEPYWTRLAIGARVNTLASVGINYQVHCQSRLAS